MSLSHAQIDGILQPGWLHIGLGLDFGDGPPTTTTLPVRNHESRFRDFWNESVPMIRWQIQAKKCRPPSDWSVIAGMRVHISSTRGEAKKPCKSCFSSEPVKNVSAALSLCMAYICAQKLGLCASAGRTRIWDASFGITMIEPLSVRPITEAISELVDKTRKSKNWKLKIAK
jgi:hypothetical protein